RCVRRPLPGASVATALVHAGGAARRDRWRALLHGAHPTAEHRRLPARRCARGAPAHAPRLARRQRTKPAVGGARRVHRPGVARRPDADPTLRAGPAAVADAMKARVVSAAGLLRAAALALPLAAIPVCSGAQTVTAAALKAAFLLNFAQFIEWSPDIVPAGA